MSTEHEIHQAMHRLSDARDGILADEAIDPESLWFQVQYSMAPVSERLVPDFHRYSSGGWVLSVYLAASLGYGSQWHPDDETWHQFWHPQKQSLLAEFYLPYGGALTLAIPGTPPTLSPVEIRPAQALRLLQRATAILDAGHAAKVTSISKGRHRK